MTEEEREILVSQQINKSHRFLTQADEVYALKHWDMAANRYYYACFHAVQGLFIHKGFLLTNTLVWFPNSVCIL